MLRPSTDTGEEVVMRYMPTTSRRWWWAALPLAAMLLAATLVIGRGPAAQGTAPPFTFYLTHYELLGDPNNPSGVRYHSNGAPFAKARDGSRITFTGQGGWDPASRRATGTGTYEIKNRSGAVRARGTWRATRFISFVQLPGWWGIENFREEGWQGPPGSASFSGFLRLRVTLSGRGSGVLRLWCLMPAVPKPRGHVGDGLSFTGRRLRFTGFREQERGLEGVMFYSR
jgi:hypothetical protein